MICCGLVSKIRGQWSECILVRCSTVVLGNRFNQEGLARHLSNYSTTRFEVLHLLVQVNLGPLKPRSSRLQLSIFLLNLAILLGFGGLPSNFSEIEAISLKSPTTSQGSVQEEEKEFKLSQSTCLEDK